jgi:hypothetical protein
VRSFFLAMAVLLLALAAQAQPARPTIAVFDAPGVGAEALSTATAAIEAAGMDVLVVGPDEVRAGALDRADAVLFTGGRGSVQGRLLGEDGRERVRAFVRAGGGYVGICAGAYLALQGEPEFHKLAIVAGRHATGDAWIRGIGPADVRPTDGSASVVLHYANGPLVAPEVVDGIAPFVTLATFASDYHLESEGTHEGEMLGAPAALTSRYGEGRIVLFSPNPTLEPASPGVLTGALRRVASREGPPIAAWTGLAPLP